LALGDKTRLRLLNLMRDREICVSSFTGTLGQSQPLISRHLAYLRNSGIVEARRDGKWMHYGISTNLDPNTQKLLAELFRWMEGQDGLRADRENYVEAHPHAQHVEPKRKSRPTTRRSAKSVAPMIDEDPVHEEPTEWERQDVADEQLYEEDEHLYEEYEEAPFQSVHHNELEDFLL
jgi:ArsR family transcriptional regulator